MIKKIIAAIEKADDCKTNRQIECQLQELACAADIKAKALYDLEKAKNIEAEALHNFEEAKKALAAIFTEAKKREENMKEQSE